MGKGMSYGMVDTVTSWLFNEAVRQIPSRRNNMGGLIVITNTRVAGDPVLYYAEAAPTPEGLKSALLLAANAARQYDERINVILPDGFYEEGKPAPPVTVYFREEN